MIFANIFFKQFRWTPWHDLYTEGFHISGSTPVQTIEMAYEDFVPMAYEDGIEMEYEGV